MNREQQIRTINDKTMPELFSTPVSWIADDTSAYRVKLGTNQTETGESLLQTFPIDGNCKIFEPKTGKLVILKIQCSLYEAKKRLGQLSKAVTAQMILEYMNTETPRTEKPSMIVANRQGLADFLLQAFENENTEVLRSKFYVNFDHLMRYIKHRRPNLGFSDQEQVEFDLYDNWLGNATAYTAFSRLLLIIKALVIDFDETCAMLGEGKHVKEYLWPVLDDGEWISLEVRLRNMILGDFVRQNENFDSIHELSNTQIRDVVFYDGFRDVEVSE